MFKEKRATDDAPVLGLPAGEVVHLPALLAANGLAGSTSDARRLIKQGAVRVDGDQVQELDLPAADLRGRELRVGRRFARIAPA